MDRRSLPAWTLAVAALALAPQAASAARLPANYVPSPGYGEIVSSARTAGTGGVAAPGPDYTGSAAGGIGPGTNARTLSAQQSTAVAPPTESPRHRTPRTKPPRQRLIPGPGWYDIPPSYRRLYRAAARRYGVDWRVLAAIGKSESDHGRSMAAGVHSGLNFASCCSGPMQMCTVASCGEVWQFYALDADADGSASVYDPPDAIYAAAALVKDLQDIFGRAHPGLILAAYNAGPAAVQRYDGVPDYPETQAYVAQGLAYMKSLRPRHARRRNR